MVVDLLRQVVNLLCLIGDQHLEFGVLVEEVWRGVDHAHETTSLLPPA